MRVAYRLTTLFILLMLSIPIYYLYAQPPEYYNTPIGVGVYKGKAFPIILEINVELGNGTVYISGIQYDDVLYKSVKVAVYEATFISGYNPYNYNYIINVSASSTASYFIGTSLSLIVYLKTLERLQNVTLRSPIMVTGTLNPDSTVGFVGDIYEKATAAQFYNLSGFIYPKLGERKYEIVSQSIHIGPYAFESKAVQVSVIPLEDLTIDLYPVLTGLDAWEILTYGYPYNQGARGIITSVATTNQVVGHYQLVKKYLDSVYNDIIDRYTNIIDFLGNKDLLVKYPGLKEFINQILNLSLSYIEGYETLKDKGYIISASKYLILAYGEIKFLEYFITTITDGREAANWIINDFMSVETRVYNNLLQTVRRGVSIENLFLLTKAARLYYEAKKDSVITLLGLSFVTKNNVYNTFETRISILKQLSEMLMKLVECDLICNILAYDTGLPLNTQTLKKLGNALASYSKFLSSYAFRYSQTTRVYSEIVNYASGYIWSYSSLKDNNDNESIILLAGMDYLVESIKMSQLYFNLHPGFDEIVKERYRGLLKTLPVYIATSNLENSISLQFNLERAIIYEDIPSKTANLERILAEAKSIIIARDLLSNQSVYVGHGMAQTNPDNINGNVAESEINKDQSPFENILIISIPLILISIVSLIVIKTNNEK